MMLIMFLISVLVVLGVVLLVRWVLRKTEENNDHAVDALLERFARGEIDESDYRERRRLLDEERHR